MALTFDVCRTRASGTDSAQLQLQNSDGGQFVTRSQTEHYRVTASGISSPDEVEPIDAASATGVPVPGQSVKVNSYGQVYPFMLCRNVSATRLADNAYVFDVEASYEEEYESDAENPNQDPEDITPNIITSINEVRETAWVDSSQPNGKPIVLPNGLLYSNPVIRRTGGLQYQWTQYENTFTNAIMKERFLTVNSTAKTIGSVTHEPRTLMVTKIKWDPEVQWNQTPGSSPTIVVTNRITYTIAERDTVTKTIDDAGQFINLRPGWDELRIRTSSLANQLPNVPKSRQQVAGPVFNAYGSAYLKADGTVHRKQSGIPPQDKFEVQKGIPFTFLN